MFVEPSDLVAELTGGGGESFESLMRSLIRAEAATHGITATDIDWDYRVNCPDGGCDVYIKKGHAQENPRFIPGVPSIWSLKGGDDGTKAPTLRAELTNNAHDRLRKHLQDGGAYVWCALQPASQPAREKMYAEVQHLAQRITFDPAKVEFRWVEALASILEEHPNLIVRHLPNLARRLKDVLTLHQWMRESPDRWGFEVNWVNFGRRDDLKGRVRDHLLGNDGPAVLHIAGISAIGKTRTAIQACLDDNVLTDTLYVARYASLSDEFLRHIESPGRHIRMIVDEASLSDYDRLSERFRECGDRIRLLTLGAARRGERMREWDPSLLIIEEPGTDEGVLKVVQEAGPDLDGGVQGSIAELSGHDLRLALLLVRATRGNPELRRLPVRTLDDVWNRVTGLFKDELRDTKDFPKLYHILTTSIDVGYDGKYRDELDYLANHFEVTTYDLARAIEAAHRSGLGTRTDQFFEAGPRALASWVFQDRLWPALRRDLDAFLAGMPNQRLRRRFLERCHELDGEQREEVLDHLGRFFWNSLGEPKLARLSDRENSRVFAAWAELDPERALPWLVTAVKNTTDDELRGFKGSPDGSGGWRGRRQIVWLCEHLACFKEHFWDCERVLFRLAQVETEESIGNNSRNTWKAMFLPILSNTEVPFPERWQHLLARLRYATEGTLELVLSAVTGAFDHIGGRVVPPAVVGGRMVPDEWRPRTWAELRGYLKSAAIQFLETIPRLRPELRRRSVQKLVEHLTRFARLDIVDELQVACHTSMTDSAFVRALRAQLDSVISWEEGNREEASPVLEPLKKWRAELSPTDLREEVIDLTSRDPWSVYRSGRGGEEQDPAHVYREMAQTLLADVTLLESLEHWLNSEQCRSGGPLGFEMGRVDEQCAAMSVVLGWLSTAQAVSFASGYLQAASLQSGALPEEAIPVLDDLGRRQPALAVNLSIESDRSARGFERIMNCLGRLDPGQHGLLRSMAFNDWPKILTEEQKDRLLGELGALAHSTDPGALAVAFDLLAGWTEHGKVALPQRLRTRGLHMLQLAAKPTLAVNDYNWKILTGLLAPQFPSEVAQIFADAITDVEAYRFQRSEDAQEGFKELAALHPGLAMKAIGRWVTDKKRGTIFRLWEFRGLFDAIGLETVRPWVREHGAVAAIRIARHLHGPHLDGQGCPIVPELADWLLTEFENEENVFREFCMGRHSGEVRSGHARDHRGEIQRLVKAFGSDPRRWIQRWAKYELDELELEIKHDDQHEDEIERT